MKAPLDYKPLEARILDGIEYELLAEAEPFDKVLVRPSELRIVSRKEWLALPKAPKGK
jgi:hypothetical protein